MEVIMRIIAPAKMVEEFNTKFCIQKQQEKNNIKKQIFVKSNQSDRFSLIKRIETGYTMCVIKELEANS